MREQTRDDGSASTTSTDLDFISPFSSYRNGRNSTYQSETLPSSQNTSWIGARMSPIAFDEEEEDERLLTAPYQHALQESMEHSFLLNERSALLANKGNRLLRDEPAPTIQIGKRRKRFNSWGDWGSLVCATAAIHLACIGIHDVYLGYLSYRLGYDIDVEHWTLPWISPSSVVLQRFGAFQPYSLLAYREWWRMISCTFLCTSVVDWLTVFGAWTILRMGDNKTKSMWSWTYLLSVLTGQIWMMAWDLDGLSGCAAWGTCGVLSATRSTEPQQRVLAVSITTIMLVLTLCEPSKSFVGFVGAALFGCAFCGIGLSQGINNNKEKEPPKGMTKFICGMIVLTLWTFPLLWIALRQKASFVTEPAFSSIP